MFGPCISNLKMKMGTSGRTGIPTISQGIPRLVKQMTSVQIHINFKTLMCILQIPHHLCQTGFKPLKMPIHRCCSIRMLHVQSITIPCRRNRNPRYNSVFDIPDRQPLFPSSLNINAGMEMSRPQLPKIPAQKQIPSHRKYTFLPQQKQRAH